MTRPLYEPPRPLLVGDLHLDLPMPRLHGCSHQKHARLLARLHSRPIGEVVVPLTGQALSPEALAGAAWSQVGDRAARHLRADRLEVPDRLPLEGLDGSPDAHCLVSRASMTRPSITVVIATRDRTESLQRCLTSLAALDYPSFDVVVVDSAPATDATKWALAGPQPWPFAVRYLRVGRPGLALAHNVALTKVTGDIIAFTDDDVEVDPHWLSALAEGFADPEVMCVTGLILPAELDTAAQLWLEQSGGFGRGYTGRRFSLLDRPADPLFPFTAGRFGSGANMAFQRGWLTAHGGFNRATGAGTPARGGDDLTAFLRVIVDGGGLVYQPSAIVRHWHRREYEGLRHQAFGYGVGLGAYLTAAVCGQPSLLPPMLRRAVPAMSHLICSHSAKNDGKEEGFPSELTWRERAGVLAGPLAYAMSCWRYRDIAKSGGAEVSAWR
jgi:GT2 family glycosyltransferase